MLCARQALHFISFLPTPLINSIKHEHSCKILDVFNNKGLLIFLYTCYLLIRQIRNISVFNLGVIVFFWKIFQDII